LVTLVTVVSILSFSLLISIETILPMFIQNAQQLSAYFGGLVGMSGALTLSVMSFLAGGLFDRYGGRTIAITGFILLVLSTGLFNFILYMNTPFIFTIILFFLFFAGVLLINILIL